MMVHFIGTRPPLTLDIHGIRDALRGEPVAVGIERRLERLGAGLVLADVEDYAHGEAPEAGGFLAQPITRGGVMTHRIRGSTSPSRNTSRTACSENR